MATYDIVKRTVELIVVKFAKKPEAETIRLLKVYGFYYNGGEKVWYSKVSEIKLNFIKTIAEKSTIVLESL
jgi:hypothetical protein